ncbi:MAG TPA: UDP-N-acetylmuramoyl-L-alanine--D-glutamate ligase [Gemmatimonadaceae bacterium]|nr:UDP-N-acetylmuramoyl-L-alanine--D-glutamate ligase [Gemmatimonadaceae bacterium]
MTSVETHEEGEVAVLGLGRSGTAAAKLLLADGKPVYVSDAGSALVLQDSARLLRDLGASVDVGAHDLDRIRRAAYVVVSPGISPDASPIAAAREAGTPLVSEIEVAVSYLEETRVIAITGTNGKTTTTSLIGHILRSLDEDAVDAGNIGTPLSDFVRRDQRPDWIALEISSFQLHDSPSLAPDVGVLTNLSPDHLDRYATVEDYYADKALLFSNASDASRWVLNADDARVTSMAAEVAGEKFGFSLEREAEAWLDRESNMLRLFGEPLIGRDEITLLGDHNIANALAAALAVSVADERFRTNDAREGIAAALQTFRSLAHRLEIVGETDGVQWINDSKATNVSSARVAIEGMRRPTILLLGGRHKGEPYTGLADAIRKSVKKVIAYGEAGPIIAKDLTGVVPVEEARSDFEEVIQRARQSAESGDAILLSPACSSFDMFRNYEERGARFKELALGD